MCEARKFVMTLLHLKQGLLFDKKFVILATNNLSSTKEAAGVLAVKFLPDGKIFDLTKLKAYADDKINLIQTLKLVLEELKTL